MIPQDRFVIVAEVKPECLTALKDRLKEMTLPDRHGMADPNNTLVPFANYGEIHFARLLVLKDNTSKDSGDFGLPVSDDSYLCFMVDCDGPADSLLARMARTSVGLKDIFENCKGFDAGDVHAWLKAHRVKPIASYVNWVGRSVAQIQQERHLHDLLRKQLPNARQQEPEGILKELKAAVDPGPLTPAPPTPPIWRIRNCLHFLLPLVLTLACPVAFLICLVLCPVVAIVLLCLLCIGALAFIVVLRRHEQTDRIVCQPYDASHVDELRKGEDHDVTNQYTAVGSLKPGRFRLCIEWVILQGINWAARHISTRGALGRIGTIHFAHWVFPDQGRPAFFCSNYDGSHEAYMDDFINKAGFGLNLSFSSSIGYPITNWLLARGAWLEQDFKRFQRRHQIPTDVWYKAYPGLTTRDLARNSRIRNGFDKTMMEDDEIRRWLAEI